ncbi:MAG: hypothetical protein WCT37_03235 [Patescibacteria group bacterium]|jgi:hypothetical protein
MNEVEKPKISQPENKKKEMTEVGVLTDLMVHLNGVMPVLKNIIAGRPLEKGEAERNAESAKVYLENYLKAINLNLPDNEAVFFHSLKNHLAALYTFFKNYNSQAVAAELGQELLAATEELIGEVGSRLKSLEH